MNDEQFKSIWLKYKWHKYLLDRAIKKTKELNKIISSPKMLEIILEEHKNEKNSRKIK